MQKCNKCNTIKEFTEFHKRKDTPTGYRYSCKECHNAHYRNKFNQDSEFRSAKRKRNRRHFKNNKDYYNAKNAKRRAAKLERTPSWLIESDWNRINGRYALAQHMQHLTGDIYHVDHIIPLQGDEVSGLHVPDNLRVVLASENLSKGNSFMELRK